MKTILRTLLIGGAMLVATAAQAALVITSEDGGERSTQYFEKGTFVLMESGRPTFGITAGGDCWFVDGRQRVTGKCDEMLDTMKGFRDQMMAGMSETDRQMMQRMMQSNRPSAPAKVVSNGTRDIAGYSVECSEINGKREVCVSRDLMNEVKREMGRSRFMELQQHFGDTEDDMGMADPETDAVMALQKDAFPMSDKTRGGAAMPGMNETMMQFLPEAQRKEIMAQIEAAGVAAAPGGLQVISVDKKGKMPKLDLSGLPTVSFEQYMQQMMGGMGGMRR